MTQDLFEQCTFGSTEEVTVKATELQTLIRQKKEIQRKYKALQSRHEVLQALYESNAGRKTRVDLEV